MPKRDSVGELERLIMLAVLHCRDDAYGYTVQRQLATKIDRMVTLGAIYTTLERLEKKGYVWSQLAEASAARGGRPKRLFHVTAPGVRALNSAQDEWLALAQGLEGVLGTI
jgi:DNA-binding PadR family transcriptional regulator